MQRPVRFTTAQRRARLVTRHHLACTAADPAAATRALVAGHSSDPVTPYLAARARVPAFDAADLDRALYEDRTLWRLHAMRRTLFVVPACEAAVFEAGSGREIARRERRKLEGWLAADMDPERVAGWLARVEASTLDALADGGEWRTQDLAAAVPELATQLTVGAGRWTARVPLSSRLLFQLALDGHVVRTRPAGSWRSSQYRWAAASSWFGALPEPMDAAAGRAELARRYLAAYGPATAVDVRWWTGWTAARTDAALRAAGAVRVELEGGAHGFVLPDDLDGAGGPDPHVGLLPGLDPSAMGWKERDWYLHPGHTASLFDRNGNAGPTVWVDGRVVGGWSQTAGGTVVFRLLEDAGSDAVERVEAEASTLTRWLDGVVAVPRFRSPLERELAG